MSEESEIARLESRISELEAMVAGLIAEKSENASDSDAGNYTDIPEQVLDIGGGGSHMGNTDDSEEIDGDVTFESADDSNVEVTTEKRTDGDEEVNVIKIGVYYV